MSAERPWKTYLVAVAIVCLVVGAGIGWAVKPSKPPADWIPPEEYEALQLKVEEYEYMLWYYRHRMTTHTSAVIWTLKEAETPWGSIWDMAVSGVRPDVETYKEWLATLLGMPPEEVSITIRVGAWVGLGREEEKWWNNGPWGFHQIFPNVKVEWDYFTDEPDLRRKLELDPEWADIIEVCGSQWKLIEEGFLAPLDPSLIPLLAEFMPEWLVHYSFYYDNKLYGVLIEWGQTSLAYRTDMFEELGIYDKYINKDPEKWLETWALLYEPVPELEGQLWCVDSCVEIIPSAIAYVAGAERWDIPLMTEWTLDPEKWAQVKEMLMNNFKPKIAKFFESAQEGYGAIQTGAAAGVICWNDMYAAGALGPDWIPNTGDEVPTAWLMPKPADTWGTAYCINSRVKEDRVKWIVAHAFLNALAAPEANVYKITEWFEGAPNRYAWSRDMLVWYYETEWGVDHETAVEYATAMENIIKDMRLNDTYYYTVEGCYWIEPPDEVIKIWEEFWLELKA